MVVAVAAAEVMEHTLPVEAEVQVLLLAHAVEQMAEPKLAEQSVKLVQLSAELVSSAPVPMVEVEMGQAMPSKAQVS
jgi:hypothetical protein